MRKIEYTSRYNPSFEAELGELVTEMQFVPFTGSRGTPETRPGWMFLSNYDGLRDADYASSGWYHVKVTPTLAQMIGARSIFEAELASLHQDHSLALQERDGKLYLVMRFQQILGSYNLCELPIDQVRDLMARAKETGHAQL